MQTLSMEYVTRTAVAHGARFEHLNGEDLLCTMTAAELHSLCNALYEAGMNRDVLKIKGAIPNARLMIPNGDA